MTDDPLDRIAVPLASVEDATWTAQSIATRFDAFEDELDRPLLAVPGENE